MDARAAGVLDRFNRTWPPERWQNLTVVVAVSGGADSTSLWTLMQASRNLQIAPSDRGTDPAPAGSLVLAHFNHQLRGPASDEAARFCANLAAVWNARFIGGTSHQMRPKEEGPRGDDPRNTSIVSPDDEQSLRNERYAFLERAAAESGARYLVTAHTHDDQVETVLHRTFRGTGVAGLAGIRAVRALSPALTLRRPLLHLTRDDLRHWLREQEQDWCEDASNEDTKYTRNRLRHDVLPRLRETVNPKVDEAVWRLAESAADYQRLLLGLVDQLEDAVQWPQGPPTVGATTVRVLRKPLRAADPMVVTELMRRLWRRMHWPQQAWTRTHWLRLTELARAPDRLNAPDNPNSTNVSTNASKPLTQDFPGSVHASCEDQWLVLKREGV